MSFSQEVRKEVEDIWEANQKHPFIQELQAGTLPKEVFRFYLLQDRYYLEAFSAIHGEAARLTEDQEIKELFLAGVIGLKDAEIAVRETFFKELAITAEKIEQTPIAPSAYHYVAHMYQNLHSKSLSQTAAALLPCYWLYQEIGESLISHGSSEPMYQRWIETYDSDGYKEAVARHIQLTNQLAEGTTAAERAKMKQAFIISSYEELQFWQMAYQKETWGN